MNRRYEIRRHVLPANVEVPVTNALAALGFTAYAIATRDDGQLDLELYGLDGVPPTVTRALTRLGAGRAQVEDRSERSLLAAHAADQACQLAPGVWVDPGRMLTESPRRLVLRIPPVDAFGDGHHPSTRLAARLLPRTRPAGKRVLDLGCGTGVLGLLAWRRGAREVVFSDIDDGSVRATRVACRANGLTGARVIASDLLANVPVTKPYGVVIANLYADVVLDLLADDRLDRALPHGALVLSGIASKRRSVVVAALTRRGFSVAATLNEAWWCGILCRR
jgi:ribosomal protein L11 methyltransferase